MPRQAATSDKPAGLPWSIQSIVPNSCEYAVSDMQNAQGAEFVELLNSVRATTALGIT